jgi:3-oxoadipate enol-lactonase
VVVETRHEPESGRFLVHEGALFFERAGSGEAVVFLHGFGLDSRMWAPQFEVLQSTFRVIRYDLRGFGRSSLPPSSGYAHEDDLNALLSSLGAAPAHIVGLSMGGRMALRFAAAYPQSVRSLVLADSALDGHGWSEDWQTRWNGMCHAARAGQLVDAKRRWLEHPLFDSARADPFSGSLLARMIHDYSGWHWHNVDTAPLPSPPLAERLGEIRMPSLVITGAHDTSDFQSIGNILAGTLPAGRRSIIKGSGHMVNLEAPREFNAALLAFWQGLTE